MVLKFLGGDFGGKNEVPVGMIVNILFFGCFDLFGSPFSLSWVKTTKFFLLLIIFQQSPQIIEGF